MNIQWENIKLLGGGGGEEGLEFMRGSVSLARTCVWQRNILNITRHPNSSINILSLHLSWAYQFQSLRIHNAAIASSTWLHIEKQWNFPSDSRQPDPQWRQHHAKLHSIKSHFSHFSFCRLREVFFLCVRDDVHFFMFRSVSPPFSCSEVKDKSVKTLVWTEVERKKM